MSRLPTLTAREVVSALEKAGFVLERQRGSHAVLIDAKGREVIVPMHSRDLKRPTMASIIKQAGLTQDQFRTFL